MSSRLGDDIYYFCVKCKRVMNHLVVSLLNDEPAKVRCRTCHGDHDFRHEQAPPPKIDARKLALAQQALEKAAVDGSAETPVVTGITLAAAADSDVVTIVSTAAVPPAPVRTPA